MEAFVNKATGSLLRIMRNRENYGPSKVSNTEIASSAAVSQREVQFSDFEAVAKLKENGGCARIFWKSGIATQLPTGLHSGYSPQPRKEIN
jgi:hypothetical protein